jgi:16S rRNA (cytosine967-C5)-methyltransferase
MTPAARIAAAIEILERQSAGDPAEAALTNWARHHRFAGSGDRAAIRDLVYEALRRWRSYGALGGSQSGRGLMLGYCVAQGIDIHSIFTGDRFAPEPVTAEEEAALGSPAQGVAALDCPEWLAPELQHSLDSDFEPVMQALRERAPVYLRVNVARSTRAEAQAALAAEGIIAQADENVKTALQVTENTRKIPQSTPYLQGIVELQDLSAQAMVLALPLAPGLRILDYCAGGGGKTLAMAALAPGHYLAHDINPARMRDLGQRAARAQVSQFVRILPSNVKIDPQDIVLTDVPCSGSGTWRRTPDAKWRLTPARLQELTQIQAQILSEASHFVRPSGTLAYMTCSLLDSENTQQIRGFLARNSGWTLVSEHRRTPLEGGDGFYLALLKRA